MAYHLVAEIDSKVDRTRDRDLENRLVIMLDATRNTVDDRKLWTARTRINKPIQLLESNPA